MPRSWWGPKLRDEIKAAIAQATNNDEKVAMFQYQVLLHANALGASSVQAKGFCRSVNVKTSYEVEFYKMMALAKLMKRQNLRITKRSPRKKTPAKNYPPAVK